MPELTASECPILMRRIVGSQAYGLATPESDTDYREVFMWPTRVILGFDKNPKTGWQSGNGARHVTDEGGWEVQEWLQLVAHGKPNAVEVVFAPEDLDDDGVERDYEFSEHVVDENGVPMRMAVRLELTEIAQGLLNAPDVRRAYVGYANNSFRKIPDKPTKWMVGYLRSLWQGKELLRTGVLPIVVPNEGSDPYPINIHEANAGKLTMGEVMDIGQALLYELMHVESVLPDNPSLEEANEWLVELRINRIT